jgi:hypothetical protein
MPAGHLRPGGARDLDSRRKYIHRAHHCVTHRPFLYDARPDNFPPLSLPIRSPVFSS